MSHDHNAPTLELARHFLLAMPGMQDDAFAHSVIYVCEHTALGALGLCINKPLGITLADLFAQAELSAPRAALRDAPVCWGGPVQTERGFVLHSPVNVPQSDEISPYASTLRVANDVHLTTSRDILHALSQGSGPDKLLVALGFAAWGPGQLEAEIARNDWLTVGAQDQIVFDAPLSQRHMLAMQALGVQQPWTLLGTAGSA